LGLLGDPGAVLRTDDAGRSWHKVTELPGAVAGAWTPVPGSGIVFLNADDALALAPDGRLYRSVDRGKTWTRLALPPVSGATIDIVAGEGCVAAPYGQGTALWTTNGGSSWRVAKGSTLVACLTAHTPPWLGNALSGHDRGAGAPVAVGGDAQVAWVIRADGGWLLLKDGGKTAEPMTMPDFVGAGAEDVAFAGADGWLELTGARSLYRTIDGGATWRVVRQP
jgi:photosystem II stability/assembly factor-like uncharacterized protein